MSEGFIALHRKILDSPVSNNPNYLAVWVFILCKVNFKDKTKIEGGKNVLYKRGEYKGSIAKIAEHFSLSRSTIKQIVDYFESEKMLYTQRTRNYTIFQVVNYDDYQGSEHKKPSRRQRTATTKNDNNEDNEDKNKQKVLIEVPSFISGEVWESWIKHRTEIKKKLTATQSHEQIKKLTAWNDSGLDANEIILNSIGNGWTGLFKPKTNNVITKRNSVDDELQQFLER